MSSSANDGNAALLRRDRFQLRQPSLAEIIGDALRARILTEGLSTDFSLPNQDRLADEFAVSKPAIREALRILEAEGLVRVRRGNVGGADVHVPTPDHAAYTLAMVLQSRGVTTSDVGLSLRELESACVRMAAMRPDREETVILTLMKCLEDQRATRDDIIAHLEASARFHRMLVASSGNETMILVCGAVESLWLSHVGQWTDQMVASGEPPSEERLDIVMAEHEELVEMIRRGEADEAAFALRAHLEPTYQSSIRGDPDARVTAAALRSSQSKSAHRRHSL
jgi:DNA-binding FadR family transcriptional regulator